MPIFDRFIRYAWAERAMELAVQGKSPNSLRDWLISAGVKGESARRTANLLTWLWFPKEENARALRDDALRLFPTLTLEEHRILHWGMAAFVFPTFRQTTRVCGRLLRLQSEFSRQDVVARILEQYSNQTTIKRSVERILQTITDWGLLRFSDGVYASCSTLPVERPELSGWLVRSLLGSVPEREQLVADVVNASELFPFRRRIHRAGGRYRRCYHPVPGPVLLPGAYRSQDHGRQQPGLGCLSFAVA